MWLLSTQQYTLEYFPNTEDLRYAILSHRWQLREVSFEDVRLGRAQSTPGWSKLQGACMRARSDGFQFIWIDTCGIDRSSSAELSEAINSMYAWYSGAAVCYVYLYDVRSSPAHVHDDLRASSWFTRGWTLQELIAPERVEFFSDTWDHIGTRESLSETIHEITRIPHALLLGSSASEDYSVAQRMSWAAGRRTTRPEDRAYSLMGLFSVNMPMLYGEGERAFLRLQEEIMKHSADHSLFAWHLEPSEDTAYHGLLAHSPDQFAKCGQIIELPPGERLQGYMQTNVGLQIGLLSRVYTSNIYHAALNCADATTGRVGIFLGFPPYAHPEAQVGRRRHAGVDRMSYEDFWRHHQMVNDFVVPPRPFPKEPPVDPVYGFQISSFAVKFKRSVGLCNLYRGVDVLVRPGTWDANAQNLTLPAGTNGVAMGFAVRSEGVPQVIGKLGLDKAFRPWVWIAPPNEIPQPDLNTGSEVIVAGAVGDYAYPPFRRSDRAAEDVLEEGFDFNHTHDYLARRYVGDAMNGVVHMKDDGGNGRHVIHVGKRRGQELLRGPIWDVEISIVCEVTDSVDAGENEHQPRS